MYCLDLKKKKMQEWGWGWEWGQMLIFYIPHSSPAQKGDIERYSHQLVTTKKKATY